MTDVSTKGHPEMNDMTDVSTKGHPGVSETNDRIHSENSEVK